MKTFKTPLAFRFHSWLSPWALEPGYASKFANQFIEFELPPQWQCNLEGAEWVCQSTDEKKKKEAIIVLAAKIAGPQDSMDQYLTYLKAAKSYTSIQGKPVKSEQKYTQNQVYQRPNLGRRASSGIRNPGLLHSLPRDDQRRHRRSRHLLDQQG